MKLDKLVDIAKNDSDIISQKPQIVSAFKEASQEYNLVKSRNKQKLIKRLHEDVVNIVDGQSEFSLSGNEHQKTIRVGESDLSIHIIVGNETKIYGVLLVLTVNRAGNKSEHWIGIKPSVDSTSKFSPLLPVTVNAIQGGYELSKEMLIEIRNHTDYLLEETEYVRNLEDFTYVCYTQNRQNIIEFKTCKEAVERALDDATNLKD